MQIPRFTAITFAAGVLFAVASCDNVPDIPPELDPANIVVQQPLITALINDDIEAVRAALEAGADPNAPGPGSLPPLHIAANRGLVEAGRQILLKKADINRIQIRQHADENGQAVQTRGGAALHMAVIFNRLKFVEMLLKQSADVNIQNGRNMTPLDLAITKTPDVAADDERISSDTKATVDQIAAASQHVANNKAIKALLLENGAKTAHQIETETHQKKTGADGGRKSEALERLKARRSKDTGAKDAGAKDAEVNDSKEGLLEDPLNSSGRDDS